ncbi:disease resistance protein RUN1 [Eucalyptus grandis]|uniref:disease resistance protein RUN1 n=1 Tax=Eucalyptus grandis TaxID=71139 RepID=UPI00192EB2AA|nr:disease resistance protein RUN1 [Eucalyptus grandis]
MEEVAKVVECKDINEGSMIPIFYEVNPSDIRKLRGNFGKAFAKTEEAYSGDKRDIKRWKDAMSKVASLARMELKDGYETKFVKQIIGEVENKLGPRLSYVVDNLVGMHSRVANIVESLCLDRSDFLDDILQDDNLRIRDDHRGANMIKERLQHKKVLVILDDVDEKEQLEKLIGGFDWFGHGSRIIITTRDEHLLLQYGVNSIYKVEELSFGEALQLFCMKAFRSNHPPAEFNELVKQIIGYADGLPLALDVLGSFLAYIGIEILVNKSLIQIVGNKLWMHDLLQEMAWEIVRRESPEEPGERSRVWLFEDGTGKIKAIVLQSGDHRTMRLNGELFTNMNNLRLLDIHAIHLSSGFKHLSNELCLLRWDNYNLTSFPPSFLPKSLVQLHMQDSLLYSLWRGEKVLEKLKVINLNGSKFFVKTPNFIYVPNLERLILKGCKALSQVHPSIGNLESLNLLDLADCENLTGLPDSVGNLKSLRVLNLFGCSNLEELPESIGGLEFAPRYDYKSIPDVTKQLSS